MPPTTRTRRDSRREAINDRLSIEVLVCPECETPSTLNASTYVGRAWCTGAIHRGHRRTRCVPRRFVEVQSNREEPQ